MTAFIITIGALYLFALAVTKLAGWIEEGNRQVDAALTTCFETGAGDWDESDTPIYDATALHIAKHAAGDIDAEWARYSNGYWGDWDQADDAREAELDRQIRDGLGDWGGDAA